MVEDGQTPETQLANLVKTIVELLQPMVVLVEIVRRVPEETEKLTGYVDASVTESTLRTKHVKTRQVVLPLERKIVHLAKPGSKVTALLEIHAETGILRIVDGTPKDNALPGKIAYSFIAAEQESSKILQLHLLQRPLQKAKPKLKAKLKAEARQTHTPVLLRVQKVNCATADRQMDPENF